MAKDIEKEKCRTILLGFWDDYHISDRIQETN